MLCLIVVVVVLILVLTASLGKSATEKYTPNIILDDKNLKMVQTVMNIVHPVGSIIITTNSDSYSDWGVAYEGTEWEQINNGYALKTTVNNATEYSDVPNSFKSTFETDEHSLSESEFPSHTHKCTGIADGYDAHTHDVDGYYVEKLPSEYKTGLNETAGDVIKRCIANAGYDIDAEYSLSDLMSENGYDIETDDVSVLSCATDDCYFERAFSVIDCSKTGSSEDLKIACLIRYLVQPNGKGFNSELLNTNLYDLLEYYNSNGNATQKSYVAAILSWYVNDAALDNDKSGSDTTVDAMEYKNFDVGTTSTSVTTSHYHSVAVASTGSGKGHSHDIILPYRTFYVWKRVA